MEWNGRKEGMEWNEGMEGMAESRNGRNGWNEGMDGMEWFIRMEWRDYWQYRLLLGCSQYRVVVLRAGFPAKNICLARFIEICASALRDFYGLAIKSAGSADVVGCCGLRVCLKMPLIFSGNSFRDIFMSLFLLNQWVKKLKPLKAN